MIFVEAEKISSFDAIADKAEYLKDIFGEGYASSALNKKNPASRRESVAGLFLLERMLNKAGICPSDFSFVRDLSGRPSALKGIFDFNISHSEEYVICALEVAEGARVGVDIQSPIAVERQKRLAGRFLSPDEAEYYEKSGERADIFLSMWTRKEAYLKYIGSGISVDLRAVSTLGRTDVSFFDYICEGCSISICCRKDSHSSPVISSSLLLNSSAVL